MTYQLIETKTLGSDAASVLFTSIPQDGTDLVLLVSGRSSRSGGGDQAYIKFNGSTANFSTRILEGNGSSVLSEAPSVGYIGYFVAATSTSNTFTSIQTYIPNYTGSTNKSYSSDSVHENNGTTAYQQIFAGLWSQTAAITSLEIYPLNGPNLVAGTTASLYKITKGTDGIVVVS